MPEKAFFLMRVNDHIQYLKKIEKTLSGEGNFIGTNHRDCQLGRWIYNQGKEEVAAMKNQRATQLFDELFEPHEQFHTISHQALQKKQQGDEAGSHKAVTEMHKLSQIITQKLLELDVLPAKIK